MGAADLGDGLAELLLGRAGSAQQVARTPAEAGEAEQQMLGGDVLVAELAHLDLGGADDAEQLGRGSGLLGRRERGQRVEDAVDHLLPVAGLLALFTAGFLGIINETSPAGLLPDMSRDLGLSESVVGQTVTVYALATALTAIPLNALLRNWGRRTVLVSALATFAVANAVAALVDSFSVLLVARFVAGVGAGLIWSNLGGYAARLVPERLQGKAVTIAMAGTPVALSLGLPAGTILGDAAGWQMTFGVTAALSVGLIAWVFVSLPNLTGPADGGHVPIASILRSRGVRPILWVVAGFMVAHSILYTYIGPLADESGVGGQVEWVLLVFGLAALLSIWVTGTYLDPHHRRLIVMSTVVLGASAFVLGSRC